MKQALFYLFVILLLNGCGEPPIDPTPADELSINFSTSPTKTLLKTEELPEISGMAASQTMKGLLWVNQDGENPATLGIIDAQGNLMRTIGTDKIPNRDCEDIAVGLGPVEGKSYVYVADIGDNARANRFKYIHRFQEPNGFNDAIGDIETISFGYPNEEMYDAEGIMVDPYTKDIYVFTKQISTSRVYRLAYPQSTNTTIVAEFIGTVPVNYATGATVSPDGREIIVRSYLDIQYWQRLNKESVKETLQKKSKSLPYIIDNQGEGISFDHQANGYYTCSELSNAPKQYMYYYKRQ